MTSASLLLKDGRNASTAESVKRLLGKILCRTFPQRSRSVYRTPTSHPSSFVDRGILYHLKQRALREGRDGFLTRLHADFWSGSAGERFSENCDYRFEDYFLSNQAEDFKAIQRAWDEHSCIRNIVEIGTCSGLLLRYLKENLAVTGEITGIDINQAQIAQNQSTYAGSGIEFYCGKGLDWVREHAKPKTMFVTNGGVLEYFSERDITKLFAFAACDASPSMVYCSEPIAVDFDLDKQMESVPFGDELSFSHNYPKLLADAGFKILSQRETQCEVYRTVATLAHTA